MNMASNHEEQEFNYRSNFGRRAVDEKSSSACAAPSIRERAVRP